MSILYTYGVPKARPIAFRSLAPAARGLAAEKLLDRALLDLLHDLLEDSFGEEPRASVALILPLSALEHAPEFTEALLPGPALMRLNDLRHPERKRQSCAARIGAAAILARLTALFPDTTFDYAEEPPYGPKILCLPKRKASTCTNSKSDSNPLALYCTLTHTKGAAALVVSRSPAGIDIEADRPVERLLRVATQAFGEAVGRDVAAELSESGSQDLFFALWGLSESVIKMNRGAPSDDEFAALRFHRNSVTLPAEVDVTVAVESRDPNTKAAADGEAAAKVVRHAARFVKTRALGLLRTTVVAEGETPPVVVEADVALLKRMFGFARPGRATAEPETRDT